MSININILHNFLQKQGSLNPPPQVPPFTMQSTPPTFTTPPFTTPPLYYAERLPLSDWRGYFDHYDIMAMDTFYSLGKKKNT